MWFVRSDSSILITDGEDHSLSFVRTTPSSQASDIKYQLIPGCNGHQPPVDSSSDGSGMQFLGTCEAVIGKFWETRLLLVRESEVCGSIPGTGGAFDPVHKIRRIAVVDPTTDCPLDDGLLLDVEAGEEMIVSPIASENLVVDENIIPDPSHHRPQQQSQQQHQQAKRMMRRTWNQIKSAPGHIRSSLTPAAQSLAGQAAASGTPNTSTPNQATGSSISPSQSFGQESRNRRRERRIMDQLLKLFNDSDSFYFSPDGDLTNSMQRKFQRLEASDLKNEKKRKFEYLDDRFFWNKFMLKDLLECEDSEAADHFILPVVQGFFQFEVCPHHESFIPRIPVNSQSLRPEDANNNTSSQCATQPLDPVMILISRRSRHMAGTRYKRRGIDPEGQVANYVETEQMFRLDKHVVSFVQVRGSIPVFWSQVGHSYRPPPKLDRSEAETQSAFEKHFQQQLDIYSKQVIVNLIEVNGRESVLGHAYLNHVLTLDNPDLTYVSFDFHEYWYVNFGILFFAIVINSLYLIMQPRHEVRERGSPDGVTSGHHS